MQKEEDSKAQEAQAPSQEEMAESQATEAAADSDEQEQAEGSPEDMNRLLEDARAKADEHWDIVLRTRAEMENLKRRVDRDIENARKYALEKFVGEIVGVWDSLELGHNAALDEAADIEKLREGTELTLKQLEGVMQKFNVEQINPEGQPFNPELHQAMSMVPSADVEPNTVVTVVQKGYTLNGRLIRPALVMVSTAAG